MKRLNLTEIKEIQLDILKSVDRFCKQNNIRYSLSFGTLLGAVRHKGYIPWDDDIDIMMPRPDYDEFINSFNSFTDFHKVKSITTNKKFPFNFAKVEDTRSSLVEVTDIPFEIGVNIDIFPIDGVPSNLKVLKKHIAYIQLLKSALTVKIVSVDFNKRSKMKNIVLMIFKAILKPFSFVNFINKIDSRILKYDYKLSDYAMIACDSNKTSQRLKKKVFEEYNVLVFENNIFPVISDYDQFLTSIYGNYMKLPPLDQQVTHHAYEAFEK